MEVKGLEYFNKDKAGFMGKHASCKCCQSIEAKLYHKLNKDKRRDYQKKWRISNQVKSKEYNKRSRDNRKDKARIENACYLKKQIDAIADRYCIRLILNKVESLNSEQINADMIESKRQLLRLKRAIKNYDKEQ